MVTIQRYADGSRVARIRETGEYVYIPCDADGWDDCEYFDSASDALSYAEEYTQC